jgi:hypothetical protein
MTRNGSVLQAALPKFAAQKELKRLLTNGGIVIDDIRERQRLEGLAEAIGAQESTTAENITERILTDPGIAPTFRDSRIRVDASAWGTPSSALTELETQVLLILKKITFFSGTKLEFLDSIRMSGLSIQEGGKIGGSSDTQSVAAKRDTHLKESKGKVFVTRDFKEASGYAEKGTKPLLVFVPTSSQSDLHVDPRSRTGFYAEKTLPMVDQEGGVFGGGVIGTIRDELISDGMFAETREIREAYLSLITKGALPSRQEQLGQLPELRKFWDPILDRLTDPSYGGVNRAAAMIIAELNDSDQFQQLALLSRLRPLKNSSGDVVGILGYLRGG